MNSITEAIIKTEEVAGRYVGDLNLLTLAAFSCNLNQVEEFTSYSKAQLDTFNKYLDTFLTTDIPVAYIVGFELFLGNKIAVTTDTLIPRFETEELVLNLEAKIRAKYKLGSELSIADICSGSGVIGVSLYNRLCADYKLTVTFVDISEEALAVTKKNADAYNLNYQIIKSDMTSELVKLGFKFDIIVSNPPYIGIEEYVQDTVLKYEPKLALYANDYGLALYKTLINDIIKISNDSFCFMLEIGETQSLALNAYMRDIHNLNFETIKDINGYDRNLYLEV